MDLEGRAIHLNKDFHTIYVGYMRDGKRHGWGTDFALKNKETRWTYSG